MKISNEVKRSIRNVMVFYVDYDKDSSTFKVYELDTKGESIGEIVKKGFSSTKNIISGRKDDLGRIHTKKEYALDLAERYNHKIESGEIKVIKCKTCGRYFYLEEKEIQWYNDNNFELPKRCKSDRRIKKNKNDKVNK